MNPFLRQLPPDLGYYHYTAGKEEFFFRRSRKIYFYGMNEQSGTDNYSVGIRQVPKSRTSSNGIELGPNLAAFRRSAGGSCTAKGSMTRSLELYSCLLWGPSSLVPLIDRDCYRRWIFFDQITSEQVTVMTRRKHILSSMRCLRYWHLSRENRSNLYLLTTTWESLARIR